MRPHRSHGRTVRPRLFRRSLVGARGQNKPSAMRRRIARHARLLLGVADDDRPAEIDPEQIQEEHQFDAQHMLAMARHCCRERKEANATAAVARTTRRAPRARTRRARPMRAPPPAPPPIPSRPRSVTLGTHNRRLAACRARACAGGRGRHGDPLGRLGQAAPYLLPARVNRRDAGAPLRPPRAPPFFRSPRRAPVARVWPRLAARVLHLAPRVCPVASSARARRTPPRPTVLAIPAPTAAWPRDADDD